MIKTPLKTWSIDEANKPHFRKLDASRTGIGFRHRWQPRDAYERRLLRTGFSGGGVAMGDFDGDGQCDIFLTRPHGGGRLYQNKGDFKFEDLTEKAGLGYPDDWGTGTAFVDLEGDGDFDLIACQHAGPNRVYLNDGNGNFVESAKSLGLAFSGASIKMIFSDYDADGDLDAFLVTNRLEPRKPRPAKWDGKPGHYRPAAGYEEEVGTIDLSNGTQKFAKAGQFDHLYRNELVPSGTLKFTDVSVDAGIRGAWHGLDAVWWDANGDLYPDLYVANDFTDPDAFLVNQGDGTFKAVEGTAIPSMPWFSMGLGSGDFDGDGRFDLMVADMAGTTHFREKMAMGAMESVDWFLDFAHPKQYMRNAVYLNTGSDYFQEGAHLLGLAKSNWTWSIKVCDLDGDGYEDIFITNGFTRDYMDSDFSRSLESKGLKGSPDAWLQAPMLKEHNMAFSRGGQVPFRDRAAEWGIDEEGIAFGAAIGDLNGDGRPDLVVNQFDDAPLIYENRSPGNRIELNLVGDNANRHGVGAVVRAHAGQSMQIRYAQFGRGYLSADEPSLNFGLGDSTLIDSLEIVWPDGRHQYLEKLEAGYRYTVHVPEHSEPPSRTTPQKDPLYASSTLLAAFPHVERPYDDFKRQPLLADKQSQSGPWMSWGDVDGDGDQDLYLGGAAGQAGQLLIHQDGQFVRHSMETFDLHQASEDMGCLFLDMDGDQDLDLYVVSGGVESESGSLVLQDRVYHNQTEDGSKVRFVHVPEALPVFHESGGPVCATDLDHDGDLDLFVGGRHVPGKYPLAPSSRILINQGGLFEDKTSDWSPDLEDVGMVTDALWADVDGDQHEDLIMSTELGPIRIFLKKADQLVETTQQSGLMALTGWWQGIAVADIDGDGDLDIAASNRGLNTKYQPKPGHPYQLYYGDFDGDGTHHLVEAKSNKNDLLPVRGLSCSSTAMPFIKEKFKTFRSFASATLSDIYPDTHLEAALHLEVAEAQSGILRNDGKGSFTFEPFPLLAQIAPGYGLAFLELNGDGKPDLFMAQNSDSPQRETGRMAGGLGGGFLNQSDGSFIPLGPDITGIAMPWDANDVESVDVNADGLRDLVVSLNDRSPMVFLKKPVPAERKNRSE
ncbi:VCBS repeat-containing protein [bacterium]|nr:VCBS repeat-containing protein [bacterium]MDG1893218.1 VCBS repeat-containing protein [Verrucomicrobiota bacterium]